MTLKGLRGVRFCDTEGLEFFGGLSFHDTERSESFGGLSYHDTESEAPFTLQKIFGTDSAKNGTHTQKNGSARVNFEVLRTLQHQMLSLLNQNFTRARPFCKGSPSPGEIGTGARNISLASD